MSQRPLAMPKPTVHSGGISAVAMATPGTMFENDFRVTATMPAAPPKVAISTSHSVGLVRASSSDCGWSSGLSQK